MTRSSHPKKEIEAALKYAEDEGWRVEGLRYGIYFYAEIPID